MKVVFDGKAGAIYGHILDTKVAKTKELSREGTFGSVDYDANGNIVGLEFFGLHSYSQEQIAQIVSQIMTVDRTGQLPELLATAS